MPSHPPTVLFTIVLTLATLAPMTTGVAVRTLGRSTERREAGRAIGYYDIRLHIDPTAKTVAGSVRLVGRPSAKYDRLELDLAEGMRVDSATTTEHGRTDRAIVEHEGARLVVRPRTPWAPTSRIDATVFYHGQPNAGAVSFSGAGDTARVASYGMPYSAREWWPSEDAPSNKADSVDVTIIAPTALTAVSNGKRLSRTESADGQATTKWAVRYPIYPDVVSIALAQYATFALPAMADGHAMPMTFYAFAEDESKARADFAVLPSVLAFYETILGPYPFAREKYGVAEFGVQSFREHQTIPSYGKPFITGDHRNDWILAHELAHQWFGNSLSVRGWDDVWLNEGFATYAALLWIEHAQGSEAYAKAIAARMRQPFATALHLPDTTDVGRMFGPVTFAKGPIVLHMLRHVLGDTVFFSGLRSYIVANNYRSVSTASMERAFEGAAGGRSLDWFFKEWVYGTGSPEYTVAWTQRRSSHGFLVTLSIEQSAEGPVFVMPIDVALRTAGGESLTSVSDNVRAFHATLSAPDSVTDIVLDPGNWILKRAVPSGTTPR